MQSNVMLKFNIKTLAALLSISCLAWSLSAKARHVGGNLGPCPRGSAPVNGSCGSPSNAGRGGQGQLPEIWRNHYGAMALSESGTVIGIAENKSSMRVAKKVALRNCVGPTCRAVVEYVNSCGSVAWGPGNSGRMGFGAEPDRESAEAKAVQRCRDAWGGECKTIDTSCSLPVRVQ